MASNIFNSPFYGSGDGGTSDAVTISAYIGSAQSIPSNTVTVLNFDTATFDTDSVLDDTGHKFTPTTAGYYEISLCVTQPDTDATLMLANIKKNDTYVADFRAPAGTSSEVAAACNAIVYMNGTTDYIQAYAWHNNTSAANVVTAAQKTHMEMFYIGA